MRYDPKKIEAKWQKKWLAEKTYEPNLTPRLARGKKSAKRPFYNLMMFPYPSAEGLHVGNMYAFTGSDIYGRLKRMQGHDVFEPIGLDGFGIHSENYAIKIGAHPMKQAKVSEKNFYRQLAMIGNGFAWDERLETYDPAYYKWTQWIFIQMFKRGLAYRKKAEVNWCLSCKTVLADEQVVVGACERCGTAVIKKELEQWFFKITDYAERLLNNLEKIDWSPRVKTAQRNWIGKSEGALIDFAIVGIDKKIAVFTTRPDTLFGATYVVLGPEHPLLIEGVLAIENRGEVEKYILMARAKNRNERMAEGKEKTGVELKGIKAINPANNEELPVWVADYVLGNVGTGAIMAVPAHDQRDFDLAKKYNLPMRKVVAPVPLQRVVRNVEDLAMGVKAELRVEAECWEGGGLLINSGQFTGLDSEKAKKEITEFVGGKMTVQYRLRDWLISRQRYWGPPIPMIFCGACAADGKGERKEMSGWYAVLEKDLPVRLPYVKEFHPTGTDQSPLASVEKFYKVRCPACKSWARRETDVSDTFLDSAWYFLRYPSVKNKKAAWDPAITKQWLPVDSYIGGAEHSVLHLLYSRFLTMAFHDWGMLDFEEPFARFRAHGLIIKDGAKMSKSKGNVVNPDEYIRAYGADAIRMYLAFMAPFEQGGDFRDAGIRGVTRFLERAWKFITVRHRVLHSDDNPELQRVLHHTIKKVTEDIENLRYNTAISALMILLNAFEKQPDAVRSEDIKIFLKLLAPFAPHVTEELWQSKFQSPIGSGTSSKFRSIHHEPWPKYDAQLIETATYKLVIQINGTMRGRLTLHKGTGEGDAARAARGVASVSLHLSTEPKKVIFVPNKLINFVTE